MPNALFARLRGDSGEGYAQVTDRNTCSALAESRARLLGSGFITVPFGECQLPVQNFEEWRRASSAVLL